MAVKKVTYHLTIPMKGVKQNNREKLKKEIGRYLVEQTLQDVGGARSPVTGSPFRGLSADYKERKKKVASGIANLELTGDMLDVFKFRSRPTGIEIGIFNQKEAQKADNHNKFSSQSLKTKVPARKFIPKKGRDKYRSGIQKEITKIINEYREEDTSLTALAAAISQLNRSKKENE